MMHDAHVSLYAWDWHVNLDGFALFFAPYSWVFPFIFIPQVILGKDLGIDWSWIVRIVYLYPYFILMLFAPIFLIKNLFPKNRFYLLAVLVFSFNTYALLLAGGEVFLALAYSLSPIIFILFIKQSTKKSLQTALLTGVILSLQIMFDPRIAYVTMFAVGLYYLFVLCRLLYRRKFNTTLYLLLYSFIIPGIVTVFLQAFWILPSFLYGKNPVQTLGSAYSGVDAVTYFSFAKFENTIALLHPNWWENIFGKVYFMRPEFLILPLLAFASLLFINKSKEENQNTKQILFFTFLGLLGAFLAKGSNDPFGGIYLWLFGHIPGFELFRDPTKWYLLIALSYAVLIPFTVERIYECLKKQKKFSILSFNFPINFQNPTFNAQNLFVFLVICYLLFLIRPALFGQLNGMFRITSEPNDYMQLETFISEQPAYFRTLWYPSKQRFSYYSEIHPEMSAQALLNIYNDKKLFAAISEKSTEKLLQEASVKYIIIPDDSENDIFLTNYKYNEKKYEWTINKLDSISWLQKKETLGKIVIYEVPSPKDHFYLQEANGHLTYNSLNPTKYTITVQNVQKGDRLIFTEQYDPHWEIDINSTKIPSNKFNGIFNSFILPQSGSYTLTVYYTPQDWVETGEWVSLVSFIVVIGSLIVSSRPKR